MFVRTDVGSYTVAVITGENGSVDPNGQRHRVRGESLEFKATAAEGYVVESVKVDGVSMDIEQGKSELTYTLNVLSIIRWNSPSSRARRPTAAARTRG